ISSVLSLYRMSPILAAVAKAPPDLPNGRRRRGQVGVSCLAERELQTVARPKPLPPFRAPRTYRHCPLRLGRFARLCIPMFDSRESGSSRAIVVFLPKVPVDDIDAFFPLPTEDIGG